VVTRRRFAAIAAAVVTWTAVVGVAWLVFLEEKVGRCFGGITPAGRTATDACYAAWRAAHPTPLLDSPLTWLPALGIGYAAIWRLALAARPAM
jgi:hypothetical protein